MARNPRLEREAEYLATEYHNASIASRSIIASQSKLNAELSKHANSVLASTAAIMQNTIQAKMNLALGKQEIEMKRAQLAVARKKHDADMRALQAAARQYDTYRTLETKGTARNAAENIEYNRLHANRRNLQKAVAETTAAENKSATQVNNLEQQIKLKTGELKMTKFTALAATINSLNTEMQKLVSVIGKTQMQFGISAGEAANLKLQNIGASFNSYVNSLKSLLGDKPEFGASAKEIADAQEAYQNQFGGILTSAAGDNLAKEAKTMRVSVEQLVQARRVFTTQSLGNVAEAKKAQDKFIAEFTKKGLTAKEAMQEIAKNSELLARNGARFAGQMARALIDAKKIGVDLSKVSQFGDSIINDFEGFLESQANLGAMGFNLDSNRLAQISETGSDADLYNELKSQLAATGKDITKLRRSERLELESAFGMSISEMQKLAGETPEGDTKSPEELQKEANGFLNRIAIAMDALGPALGLFTGALSLLTKFLMARSLGRIARSLAGRAAAGGATAAGDAAASAAARATPSVLSAAERAAYRIIYHLETPFVNLAARLSSRLPKIADAIFNVGSRLGQIARSGVSAVSRVAGRIPAGVRGALRSTARVAGRVAAPAVALYDSVSEYRRQRATGTGKGTAATMGAVKGAGMWAGWAGGAAIGGAVGRVAGTGVGAAVGSLGAGVGAIPGAALGGTVGNVAGYILGGIAGVLAGEAGANWVNENITKKFASQLDKAGDKVGAMWESVTGWFSSPKPATPRKPAVSRGNDVVSQPGYGKRSLVTPSGVIALNNKDNIIAYADDLDGTKKLPYGSIAKKAGEKYEQLDVFKKQVNDTFAQFISPSGGFGQISKFLNKDLGATATNKVMSGKVGGAIAKAQELNAGGKEGLFAMAQNKFGGMFGGNAGKAVTKAQELKAGGAEGLLSMAQGKFGGMFGGKAGSAMSSISNLFTGGGSTSSNLMGMASKIPGIGGLLGKATGALGSGGLKGIGTSLLGKVGLGSLGGSLLGGPMGLAGSLAAPLLKKIPFVGGALASIAGGPGKLMGSALGKIGGLFGKKKAPAVSAMGAMMPDMGNMMSMLPFLSGAQSTTAQGTTQPQAPISVDTSGIEKQLNNFINALQGIQIHMDGAKVGKALVNSNDAASSLGVFREQSR